MWDWFNNVRQWFTRTWDGFMPFNLWSATPIFNNYGDDLKKLQAVFSNPALLKVFALQCDLFSLGKIYVYKDGKDIGADPALDRLKNPNPMQSQNQWLWDYMFWLMLNTAYLYVDSDLADKENNKLYFLETNKMEFPLWLQRNADKMIFSKALEKEFNDQKIIYRYQDGSTIEIPLSKIITFTDLTNGNGNWFKSNSRIDALYKVVSNTEAALDSENINLRYSGKFLVAGTSDPNDVTKLPLAEDEKRDIEKKVNGREQVTAVKSMIEIKRFVENMAQLQLNEKYLSAYFLIGNMYNIPKDVLEAFVSGSATYENQEKARGAQVSYTLQPKGDDLMNRLSDRWGYTAEGKKLVMKWDHLPFMQVFAKDTAEIEKLKSISFANLINQGVPLEEVNEYLDTNFSKGERNYVASTAVIKPAKGQEQQASTTN
jgi:hypothetical protein